MRVAQRRTRSFWTLADPFVSFLFPPICLACKSPLPPETAELCPDCRRGLRRVAGNDAVYQQTLGALTSDGRLDRLVAPFYFEKQGPLQQIIHQLKYNGLTRIGLMLGGEIAEGILTLEGTVNPVIVPVPLHRSKLRERGYNQSYHIGRGMAKVLRCPVLPHALNRTIYTQSQTTLDSVQRATNVEGAFRLSKGSAEMLGGTTVLLVDDVITTGATIRSCAMTLRQADVAAIIACAAALAQ